MTNTPKPLPANVVQAPDLNCKPAQTQFIGGSRFENFNMETINQLVSALWTANSKPEDLSLKQNACLEALAGIGPKDEVEGMLATQMVACHAAAMECFRRAMIKEQPFDGRQQNLNFANKLLRTYAMHMEALDKHPGQRGSKK